MLKRFFLIVLCISLFFSAKVSAESASAYDWDSTPTYDFHCERLVNCVDSSNNKWDHSVYYFEENDNKCLVILCHGFVDSKGEFGIVMHKQFRYDYAQAVAESLAYWSSKGYLKCGEYDYVFLNSCYIGNMPSSVKLPVFNVNLVRAFDHKNVTGHVEDIEADGRVRLRLYRGYPKSLGKTKGVTAPPQGIVMDTEFTTINEEKF